MDLIGRTLFVDLGQQVDPNLIEALCYEVLNEKIASMIFNKDYFPTDEFIPPPLETIRPQQPIPSPRKSLEFLEQQKDRHVEVQVATPIVTPTHSPPHSPRPKPQEPAKPVAEKFQQTEMIQMVKFASDDESILQMSEDDEHECKFKQNIWSEKLKLFL